MRICAARFHRRPAVGEFLQRQKKVEKLVSAFGKSTAASVDLLDKPCLTHFSKPVVDHGR